MNDRDIMQQAREALTTAHLVVDDDMLADEIEQAFKALNERLAHCDRCGKRLGEEGDIHTCTPLIGCVQHDCAVCKARLAQPEQEPVAWMFQHEETGRTMCVDAQQVEWGFEKGNPRLKKIAPLYTTPPAQRTWVGLTKYQRAECWYGAHCFEQQPPPPNDDYAIAIEAKLKEKNT